MEGYDFVCTIQYTLCELAVGLLSMNAMGRPQGHFKGSDNSSIEFLWYLFNALYCLSPFFCC